jgi:hypothetical protein
MFIIEVLMMLLLVVGQAINNFTLKFTILLALLQFLQGKPSCVKRSSLFNQSPRA